MEAKYKMNTMKKTSIILGTILGLSLAVFFVACSKEEEKKTYSCECLITWHVTGETHTISMGTGEKECKSLGFSDIISHVGGDATNSSEYSWTCYDK